MRTKQRIPALLLALLMLLSIAPPLAPAVVAAEPEPVEVVVGHTAGWVSQDDVAAAIQAAGVLPNETPFSVRLQEGATALDEGLFNGYRALVRVEMPTVTSINMSSFNGCTALVSVDMPKVTGIGENTFYGCTSLTELHMPKVRSIGMEAFRNCASLTQVYMPELWWISELVFNNCPLLAEVTVLGAVSIGEGTFGACPLLTIHCGEGSVVQQYALANGIAVSLVEHTHFEGEWETNYTSHWKSCICGKTMGIADHTPGEWEPAEPALCREVRKCTVCGEVMAIRNLAEATAHRLGEWEITKEANCTRAGTQLRKCLDCGETVETKVIEKTNDHVKNKLFWVTVKATSCKEMDRRDYPCTVCGKVLESVPDGYSVPHKTGTTWKTTKAATCKAQGVRTLNCTVCGIATKTEYTAKLKTHKPGTAWKTTKAATCKATGTRTLNCTVCGVATKTETIAKLKTHKPGAWTTAKAATCKATGTQVRQCTVCAVVLEIKDIPKHKPGAWKTVTAATAAKPGKQEQRCTVCNAVTATKVLPAKHTVKLNRASATLGKSETYKLTATTGIKIGVTWSSSNTKVATVSSGGTVTAKGEGTANITVKTAGGQKAVCKITVKKAPASMTLNKTSIILGKGEAYTLTASPNSGAASLKRTWKSSNSKVVKVDENGKITAVGTGTATITVTSFNGKVKSCKVNVKAAPTSVKLSKSTLTLAKGKTAALSATLNPSGAASYKKTWTSSNTKVATVDASGKVKAVGKGKATITCKTYNNKSKTCTVTVQ